MNKQEIVALINAAIAGQGSQVDISGKLPAILSSIVDLIPESENKPLVVESVMYYDEDNEQQRLRLVGITKNELIYRTLEKRVVLVHAVGDKGSAVPPKLDYAAGFAYLDDGVLMIEIAHVLYTQDKIDD